MVKMINKKPSQRGNMMLATAIAVLAGSVVTLTTAKSAINSANETTGAIVGNQLQTVVNGLNSYIQNNSASLNVNAVSGVAKPLEPTIDELKSLGYINTNFSSVPKVGGAFVIQVSKVDANCTYNCSYEGVSYLRDPLKTTDREAVVDIRILQTAVTSSKSSQIGFSLPSSTSTVSGPGWSFTNPDASKRAGILVATTNYGTNNNGNKCGAFNNANLIDCTGDTQLLNNSGTDLTAIGTNALKNHRNGKSNVAVGADALTNNAGGSYNVAAGSGALRSNTYAYHNVAVGYNAAYGSGSTANVAVGSSSLAAGAGSYNVAVGYETLKNSTNGAYNVAAGAFSQSLNTSGVYNSSLGAFALFSNTTGYNNVGVGFNSMYSNISGRYNVAVGANTLNANSSGSDNVAVGNNSLYKNLGGSNNVGVGSHSLYNNTSGSYNVAVGESALRANTTGNGNAGFGHYALFNNAGNYNVAVGIHSLRENTTGERNTSVGSYALMTNKTGSGNVATGDYALNSNTSGDRNVAFGSSALNKNTTGNDNVGIGTNALYYNTTGFYNTATGSLSLISNLNGNFNAAYGARALFYNTTGIDNVAIGYSSLYSNTGGNGNVAIGRSSLYSLINGIDNVAVGNSAGPASDLSNSISIGKSASATASNTAQIGNSLMTWIGGQVGWSTRSDRRSKENIRESNRGLTFINQLVPVDYTLIDNKKPETGFIAQDVEAIDPDFPGIRKPANDAEFYSLTYTDFIPSIVKSIQELDKKIESIGGTQEQQEQRIFLYALLLAVVGLVGWNISLQRSVNKLKKAA